MKTGRKGDGFVLFLAKQPCSSIDDWCWRPPTGTEQAGYGKNQKLFMLVVFVYIKAAETNGPLKNLKEIWFEFPNWGIDPTTAPSQLENK